MAHILVIEDDDLLRGVLVNALEQSGHIVTEAADGRKGVLLYRASPTHIVITDLVMPVQEGIETILALRRETPGLPIIAMSGGVANTKLYLEMAGKIGARRILAKPFTPQHLINTVNEVLREISTG